jgi:hypothetical protein
LVGNPRHSVRSLILKGWESQHSSPDFYILGLIELQYSVKYSANGATLYQPGAERQEMGMPKERRAESPSHKVMEPAFSPYFLF